MNSLQSLLQCFLLLISCFLISCCFLPSFLIFARVFHMKTLFTIKKVKNNLATNNPAVNRLSEKVPEELLPKIRDHEKKPAEPSTAHHRHPPPADGCPPFGAPSGCKVSAGRPDRWPEGGPPAGEAGQVPAPTRLKVTISRWRTQGYKLTLENIVYHY